MRLPNSAQTSQPWRIHEFTHDFRLEDVWALPTPGGPDDFPRLLEVMRSNDPSKAGSAVLRFLFAARWALGRIFGWDHPERPDSASRPTLRERLPVDLRPRPSDADVDGLPFTPLYETGNEFAAEIANRTVHGVVHLGWVPDERGGYRGQMSVYVKPNGILGRAYMAAIKPFRYLIVYPRMFRGFERAWQIEG